MTLVSPYLYALNRSLRRRFAGENIVDLALDHTAAHFLKNKFCTDPFSTSNRITYIQRHLDDIHILRETTHFGHNQCVVTFFDFQEHQFMILQPGLSRLCEPAIMSLNREVISKLMNRHQLYYQNGAIAFPVSVKRSTKTPS